MRIVFGFVASFMLVFHPAFGEATYQHSEDGSPRTLDPVAMRNLYANTLITSVYDTLLEYKYLKEPYELKTNLASSMPYVSANGLSFTIPIKKGVFFQNDSCFAKGVGREVVAEDFIFSMKRHFDKKNASTGKWLWQGKIKGLDEWGAAGADYSKKIAGLFAKDKYTIQIILKKPFPQFLYTLAMGFAAVVPREAVDKYGKELAIRPVGSGPWVLKEFNSKKAILEKNKRFRSEVFNLQEHGYDEKKHAYTGIVKLDKRKLPIMDKIELHFMEAESSRWNSFTKGSEVQYSWIPSIQFNQVLETRNPVKLKSAFEKLYKFRVMREMGYVYMEFNMNDPLFGYHSNPEQNKKNRALRCAIRKGFNWQDRIQKMYYGIGQAFPGIIPPGIEGANLKLSKESITLDIAGAKRLLEENGWNKNNLPDFYYSGVNSVKQRQFFTQFRSWMEKIGYPKRKIKSKMFANFGDYSKAVKSNQLMVHILGWGLDYPDAENVLQLYYGPNKSPGSNSSNYDNPKYNRLYEKSASMQPGPERTSLYEQANQILIDDCVVVSGFSRTRVHMWHKNVVMYPNRDVLGNYFKYIAVE